MHYTCYLDYNCKHFKLHMHWSFVSRHSVCFWNALSWFCCVIGVNIYNVLGRVDQYWKKHWHRQRQSGFKELPITIQYLFNYISVNIQLHSNCIEITNHGMKNQHKQQLTFQQLFQLYGAMRVTYRSASLSQTHTPHFNYAVTSTHALGKLTCMLAWTSQRGHTRRVASAWKV